MVIDDGGQHSSSSITTYIWGSSNIESCLSQPTYTTQHRFLTYSLLLAHGGVCFGKVVLYRACCDTRELWSEYTTDPEINVWMPAG